VEVLVKDPEVKVFCVLYEITSAFKQIMSGDEEFKGKGERLPD
jgi:hypothetical protein